MYCSCPYALDGRNCKHMAAVLYEWSENEAEEKKDEENAINTDLFQPAYTVNSHKKKLTAVEGLVSGVVERVQRNLACTPASCSWSCTLRILTPCQTALSPRRFPSDTALPD